jgi:OPT family oligopeptide transporter
MIAAGAIMGIRVGISLLLGAVLYFGVIGPMLVEGKVVEAGYRGIISWTLWPATALMVTSSMVSLGLKWRTIVRAFSGLKSLVKKGGSSEADPMNAVDVPTSWFLWGTLVAGGGCVYLGHIWFGVTWWMGILAVFLTFFLAIVAARATGETDVTPIGAMGKITQLTYGVLAPSNITTNLMTASITAGASSHAADLLTDLKSGYLLGANPRKQTIAQLFGVVAGSLMAVPAYLLVVRPQDLGTSALPAPSAKVWAGVAEMLAKGVDSLPKGALMGMIFGGLLGAVLSVAEEYLPKSYKKWLPSATGLGIAGVIPAFNSVSMFIGSLLAWLLTTWKPQVSERYTITVSSGLIAGESLMGVAIIIAAQGSGMIDAIMKAFGG